MKVWQVTRNYYDGDHDHGYYDYGLYETESVARNAAEKVAENLVNQYEDTKWESSWEWLKKYSNVIVCHIGMDTFSEYIRVTEKEILTEVKENIEETKPTITYT
jgi:3-keto-L-gulonate-6-phosphate decarboxylase